MKTHQFYLLALLFMLISCSNNEDQTSQVSAPLRTEDSTEEDYDLPPITEQQRTHTEAVESERAITSEAMEIPDEEIIMEELEIEYEANEEVIEEESATNYLFSIVEHSANSLTAAEPRRNKKKKKLSKTWKRSDKTANEATLFIGDKTQLPLKGQQVVVKIDGFRARVLTDCFFYSDEKFVREGTFKMRLPQGAVPYYFAFGETVYLDDPNSADSIPFVNSKQLSVNTKDIEKLRSGSWKAPKVARVVANEKAAFAYDQTVKKSIDPALVEWAGADVYNCRVFPLLPKKLHRIVIGYEVNLTSITNDWTYQFDVPKVPCPLIVDFDVAKIYGVKSIIQPKQELKTKKNRQIFRVTNPKESQISIHYKNLKNSALTTKNIKDKTHYFGASFTPDLPRSTPVKINDQAIFMLDISLSSNPDKFNIWLQMTKAILANNQDKIKQFNVLCFNVESFWWQPKPVSNNSANIKQFLSFANQLALEGASDLNQALAYIAQTPWSKNHEEQLFLLSDGDLNWGESDPYVLTKKIGSNDRLFAFNTGMSGTSINLLSHLTRSTGGALFSITGEDEIVQASTAFRNTPWNIEEIKIQGAQDILIQGRPTVVYPGQKLIISGRGALNKHTKIQLQVSLGAQKQIINTRIKHLLKSEMATRVYGQMATNTLEGFDYTTEQQSIAYAKHFGIPGKTCSLLMLDSEDDYKEYDIKTSNDEFVVKSTTVNQLIGSVLANIDQLLGSSKAKFKAWLVGLSHTSGMTLKIPAALELVVNQMDEKQFIIHPKAIISKSKNKNDLSKAYRAELGKVKLDYDIITAEANQKQKLYGSGDALKTLSSLIERNPSNAVVARDVAYSALQWGLNEQAYFLLQRIIKSRPYEPQTYLGIAQTLSKIGKYELALVYYEIAVTAKWNDRFGDFNKIATLEYLHALNKMQGQAYFSLADYAQSRYKQLKKEMDQKQTDLMVVISWNTNNTDIDLHVIEPTGERCYYQHKNTKMGGQLTKDVTQGYGPEMYVLPKAETGDYQIKAKLYSSDRNRNVIRTKVFATIYQNWGTPQESVTTKVITLKTAKTIQKLMQVKID